MKIKPQFWKQAWRDLAEQTFDLLTGPDQSPIFPCPPDAVYALQERHPNLEWPESLLRLDETMAQHQEEDTGPKLADWAVIYQLEILKGMGTAALSLDDRLVAVLQQLAGSMGSYLAGVLGKVVRCWQLYQVLGDMMLALRQIPAPLLGDMLREMLTPQYLKAEARVQYGWALTAGDRNGIVDARAVLEASEADLQMEINRSLLGFSSRELGTLLLRYVQEVATYIQEIFNSPQWKDQMLHGLHLIFQRIAANLGYGFACHMASHPQELNRVLEALKNHGELEAMMEQYRWIHGWDGDRNNAIKMAWSAVAPQRLGLSGNIEKIHTDEAQSELEGVVDGLDDYSKGRTALTAVLDGVSGGIKGYLAKAAKNEELDRQRKLKSRRKRAATQAKHTADLKAGDRLGEGETDLSEEEILSRLSRKFRLRDDEVGEKADADEILSTMRTIFTQQQWDAVMLTSEGYKQREVALKLGLSQQRISQILAQSRKKLQNPKKSKTAA